MPPATHTRRYSAFISYRHADNTQEGRRWAEWLHRALERYVVPPDLIGTPNLRGEPIRDSLYPIFRDEDELPANADLATGIRAALEVSDHLIVLCSPRSAVSPWVRKEVREFKELGRSDRILAIIIAGEPNADDPAKARDGILRDEECFCEELRFGAVREDGTLDWTIRTEPLAADLRPVGTRAEGFVTAEAYREHLTLNSSLTPEKIAARTDSYRHQLEHSLIKVIAGLLGVPLGQLVDRDAAHRAELAKQELARAEAEAARLRALNERLTLAEAKAREAAAEALAAKEQAEAALAESQRQLERSQLEEGRAWLERAKAAENRSDHLSALMLAGRAVGFQGYGRVSQESDSFSDAFPLLLGKPMADRFSEKERQEELLELARLTEGIQTTFLPIWACATPYLSCVAISPDSRYLATVGSHENAVSLWDAITGDLLGMMAGHTDSVWNLMFSPDGGRLASGSHDKTVRLWDVNSRRELIQFSGHDKSVWSVAFSPDGSRLTSGSGDKTIKVWNALTGEELATLSGHNYEVRAVAFSPDGKCLATGSTDETVKLWDSVSGEELASLAGHTRGVMDIAFRPDGDCLATASADATIKLWDVASGTELAVLAGHTDAVRCVAFSPDGKSIASGSRDHSIRLWDTNKGEELAIVNGHTKDVCGIAFAPDGSRLVSSSYDKTVKLWDVTESRQSIALAGHADHVWSVALSPDGNLAASGSHDRTIKIWDTARGREIITLAGHAAAVLVVTFSPNGKPLASGSHDRTIRLWDTASTGKEFATLTGHNGSVRCIAFSPDGKRIASGSHDKTVKLWDSATGKELATFVGNSKHVLSLAFSPDGSRLVSGTSYGDIKLWDIASFEEIEANDVSRVNAQQWLAASNRDIASDGKIIVKHKDNAVIITHATNYDPPDLAIRLREGLLALAGRELKCPEIKGPTKMLPVRYDVSAQLADPKLTPERRAELRMELCTKSSQFRAATALWQRLLQGEWRAFEGATVPKDQAPATIPADSPIRRLYLLALIDATKHPQIHGHPTICQTATQIVPVLTTEMLATPTISLAMMTLMQTLAKDDSPDMSAPHADLLKRLEEVATQEWLEVLRESAAKK
ncbi:MAG: TIR domain-containing protein [Verrucomicrobiaceae bacterium]|nr:TIR domain-containing protein [Verrucomicrobiaceae bacterium]